MDKLSKEEYIKALRSLEESSSDKIGILGTLGVVGTGTGFGALGSVSLASFFGASTLFGSTTLASLTGGVFVVSTPIGWVVGTAIAGATVAFGLSKLVKSGGRQDEIKINAIRELKVEIIKYNSNIEQLNNPISIGEVANIFAVLLENNLVDETQVTIILSGIESGKINAEYAISIAQNIIDETEDIVCNNTNLDLSNMAVRSVFVILYKYIIHVDTKIHQNEMATFVNIMKQRFQCSNQHAIELFNNAPNVSDIDTLLKDSKQIISIENKKMLIDSLVDIASSDGEYCINEKAFIAKVKEVFNL